MDLKLLIDIGLTETEARLYLALLELGKASVVEIAKKSRVKRPTCYVNLDSMIEKGFVSKLPETKRLAYVAVDPKIILRQLKSKVFEFEELVPYYRAKLNKDTLPQILFYEGREELQKTYKRVVFTDPSDRLYAFGTNVKQMNQTFPKLYEEWHKYYVKRFKDVREIVVNNTAGKNYIKKHSDPDDVRLMPPELTTYSDTLIMDSKVFMVSLDNLFGILIDSVDIADTYANFFKLAWRSTESTK